MTKSTKKVTRKKVASKGTVKRTSPSKMRLSFLGTANKQLRHIWQRITLRRRNFLARRPHRSFRRSRRRDYSRSLAIPGYISFTIEVNDMIRMYWKLFLPLTLLYASIMVILGAITSQDVYTSVSELLSGAGKNIANGGISSLAEAGLVAVATFASGGNNLTAEQGVYLGLTLLFVWLATVWLLREVLAGRKPRLRDGLYNSGAPVLSTVGVLLVIALQLVPVGLTMLVYAGLSAIGAVNEGFGAMLFWLFSGTVAVMVLYWVTSTILALVVVTIPGMYPLRAVTIAGDLVVGRRLRILLRLLWGAVLAFGTWAIVLVLSVLVDKGIKMIFANNELFSIVPYVGAATGAFAVVWFAAYVYLFYRKVVEDDAKPA